VEKPACLYPTVSDKADAGRPQENEHQERGGRTLDNSEYPFEVGAAALIYENENPFNIGAAALINENENSFEIEAAAPSDENENPFNLGAVAVMRIPLK